MYEPVAPAAPTGKLYIVKNGAAKERLVRAGRRSQVESYILQDYEVVKATADDVYRLAKSGVEEEAVS